MSRRHSERTPPRDVATASEKVETKQNTVGTENVDPSNALQNQYYHMYLYSVVEIFFLTFFILGFSSFVRKYYHVYHEFAVYFNIVSVYFSVVKFHFFYLYDDYI